MTTKREQIMRAVVSALNDASRPAGVPAATRANAVAVASGQLPKVAVVPVRETVQRVNNGQIVQRSLTLRVECQAAGLVGSEEAADALLDNIVAWCTQALAGNRLGGLALSTEEAGTDWAVEVQDYAYCAAVVDFVINYETAQKDQAA